MDLAELDRLESTIDLLIDRVREKAEKISLVFEGKTDNDIGCYHFIARYKNGRDFTITVMDEKMATDGSQTKKPDGEIMVWMANFIQKENRQIEFEEFFGKEFAEELYNLSNLAMHLFRNVGLG